jgi:Fur family ferric uptake transcriptional regulator
MHHKTHQQTAILQVLENLGRPVTPQELLQTVRKKSPGIGLATVYRALKRLTGSGEVRKIEVAGLSPHYEHVSRHHHHFFLCKQCRHLFTLIGCVRGVNEMAPAGFQVESHEIILYGNCPDCLAA